MNAEFVRNRLIDGGGLIDVELTRTSSTGLQFVGDWTALIPNGTKLEVNDNGTLKYAYVKSKTYTGGDTVLTITAPNLADRTISTISTANNLTNLYLGNLAAMRAFPVLLKWAPGFTGFSANPTGDFMYRSDGRWAYLVVYMSGNGTSSSGTFQMTAPFTAATLPGFTGGVWSNARDNGAVLNPNGAVNIQASTDTITIEKDFNSTSGWTTSGGKRASYTIAFPIS